MADDAVMKSSPQRKFVAAVSAKLIDSVVCFSDSGQIEYPTLPDAFDDDRWREAVRLEYEIDDVPAALKIYDELADAEDSLLRAFAQQSEVRCLFKTGDDRSALRLTDEFSETFPNVRDKHGRLIAASVELMAIELAGERSSTQEVHRRLTQRLADHDERRLPSSQRLFLMSRLNELLPNSVD